MKSFTNTVLMVRPANFGYNAETAENNAFQTKLDMSTDEVRLKAREEFDEMVSLLRSKEVEVIVIEDTEVPIKPDAIFPNNWFSTHQGSIAIYPMHAMSRRVERRGDIIDNLMSANHYASIRDYTHNEQLDIILEGTGSLILDRDNMIAYACTSVRTHEQLFLQWCQDYRYEPMSFLATDRHDQAIYHTNVMMALGSEYVVICMDSIKDLTDRQKLLDSFSATGKEVITISFEQMEQFAGNMLQVEDPDGKPYLVMSKTAYETLDQSQITQIEQYAEILSPDITLIETIGGGSVRCMMAEIFA